MNDITIRDDFIKLGQALKLAGAVQTGADAKFVIEEGQVKVNGDIEIRRGKKLYDGDVVAIGKDQFTVHSGKKI